MPISRGQITQYGNHQQPPNADTMCSHRLCSSRGWFGTSCLENRENTFDPKEKCHPKLPDGFCSLLLPSLFIPCCMLQRGTKHPLPICCHILGLLVDENKQLTNHQIALRKANKLLRYAQEHPRRHLHKLPSMCPCAEGEHGDTGQSNANGFVHPKSSSVNHDCTLVCAVLYYKKRANLHFKISPSLSIYICTLICAVMYDEKKAKSLFTVYIYIYILHVTIRHLQEGEEYASLYD